MVFVVFVGKRWGIGAAYCYERGSGRLMGHHHIFRKMQWKGGFDKGEC